MLSLKWIVIINLSLPFPAIISLLVSICHVVFLLLSRCLFGLSLYFTIPISSMHLGFLQTPPVQNSTIVKLFCAEWFTVGFYMVTRAYCLFSIYVMIPSTGLLTMGVPFCVYFSSYYATTFLNIPSSLNFPLFSPLFFWTLSTSLSHSVRLSNEEH